MSEKTDVLVNAQVSVLGSMLIDGRCVGVVLPQIKAEYFSVSQYRHLYETVRDLTARGRPVDPVTVVDAAGKEYYDLVAQLMQVTPTAKNVGAYCQILKREARMQMLKDAASEMLGAEDEDAVRAALDKVNAVMVERPGIQAMTMAQALADFYRRHDPKIKPNFLPWGFPSMNDILVERGDLVFLGGYPSDGKTTLALATAREQAKTRRVGFFSFETSCAKLTDAMVCAAARIGLPKIQLNAMNENDWDTLAAISADFSSRNLEIVDAAGMSVTDIRLYSMAHHYDVIYIDYLQLIPAPSRAKWMQDDFNRVSENSRSLKEFGRTTGTTVVALSQMTRPEVNKKTGKIPAPSMSNLRSSGQLEQDADVIFLLFRENQKEVDCNRTVTVAKVKTGEAGWSFDLRFEGAMQTFREGAQKPKKPVRPSEQDQQDFREMMGNEPLPF